MIAVTKLHVVAGSFALRDICFSLEAGEYGVLMGKTGSGKTTILEAVSGLKPVAGGSIQLLGREVSRLKPAERGVGYVPQDRALFPCMTVGRHLSFALELRHWGRAAANRRVAEMADLLGIAHLLGRMPQGLSGGEAQRVALGRALSYSPRVLLLDEPLSALDEETRDEMCRLLKKVQHETHVTTLHVTHNPGEARRLADRFFVLRDGKLHEAPAAELHGLAVGPENQLPAGGNGAARVDPGPAIPRRPEAAP
jgi:ABC-type sugar transport system ATPase subunit